MTRAGDRPERGDPTTGHGDQSLGASPAGSTPTDEHDLTAASIGFIVAGIALAAALLGGPAGLGLVPVGVAGLVLLVFGLRRYGVLGSDRGAGIAIAASLGLAGVASGLTIAPAVEMPVEASTDVGLPVAAIAGVLATLAAGADRRGISGHEIRTMARAAGHGLLIGFGGLVAIVAWSGVLALIVQSTIGSDIPPTVAIAVSTLALGLGTGSVAAFVLRVRGVDRSYLDLHRPTVLDLAYVVGGVLVILGLNLAIGLAFMRFGVESATHSVVRQAQSTPGILLVLIPLSYLVIAPGEELLFRNVIQKTLYHTFTKRGAVVVASGIFALAHIFAYADPSGGLGSTIVTLAVIFALSMILGWVYARTDNLVVPILVHGTFNAIAFAATYAEIVGIGV